MRNGLVMKLLTNQPQRYNPDKKKLKTRIDVDNPGNGENLERGLIKMKTRTNAKTKNKTNKKVEVRIVSLTNTLEFLSETGWRSRLARCVFCWMLAGTLATLP